MPRYAKAITIEEMDNKFTNGVNKALLQIPNKDIGVEIHFDKIDISKTINYNGLVIRWVSIASEWDSVPITFAVYIDKQDRLRAYLPKHGNTYNPWTATAFGSERAWPNQRHSICNMPEEYYEENTVQGGFKETEQYKNEFENLQSDINLMRNELLAYIKVMDE